MRSICSLLLVLLAPSLCNRAVEFQSNGSDVFSSTELGFSFTPPPGLRDLTAVLREKERRRPPDDRTHFAAVLWMVSGPDDTAADWVAVGIETLPRARSKDPGDDVTASFFTNYAALPGEQKGRSVTRLSGQDFAVTRIEKKEPPLTKHGMAYTTVRKEQFITFVFAGNVRDRVEKAAESMNSLKFIP